MGDEVVLFDGRGGEYAARVGRVGKHNLGLEILAHRPIERELPFQATLVQGVSSGERMEFTIRKAVELGVSAIYPVLVAASVARPKGERAASRQSHWQKIAVSACEQCGRNRIPVVHPIRDDLSFLAGLESDRKLLLSPGAGDRLSSLIGKGSGYGSYVIAAGPEAGFGEREEAAFLRAGFAAASLGPRILRTETAALAALAALNALRGDF